MKAFSLSPLARDDLRGIWQWIAPDNERAADELTAEIKQACEQIAEHPQLGGRRSAWSRKPVRFFLIRTHYWIVYNPETSPLEILRIIHAARDIPAVLAAGN